MIINNSKPITKIGIFDSGIGGLSILRPLLAYSNVKFFYAADTAHVPYGKRSQQEIQQLSLIAIKFLVIEKQVDLVIIACHTVSTNALDFLKEQFPTTLFIDVVDSVIEQALAITTRGIIGIWATKATAAREVHKKKLLIQNPNVQVITQACPRLASAIENHYENKAKLTALAKHYFKPLQEASIDTLILGCTHYALIQELLHQVIGTSVTIISAENQIQKYLMPFLQPHQLNLDSEPSIEWFTSGALKKFSQTASSALAIPIKNVSKITEYSPT